MFRRSFLLAAVLVLSLAAASPGALSGPALWAAPQLESPVDYTEIIEFFPTQPLGRQARGECWTTSNVMSRPNAWRCMVGNNIYDPCFSANESAPWVACDINPLSDGTGAGLRVNLTQPLPSDTYSGPLYAWYLQFPDGTTCYSLGRDAFTVRGAEVNYACAGADFILGSFTKDGDVWYARRIQLTPDLRQITWSVEDAIAVIWY